MSLPFAFLTVNIKELSCLVNAKYEIKCFLHFPLWGGWVHEVFLKATDTNYTLISYFCHTIPLTPPLIISSLYPWNLISNAPKQQTACPSGHRSCVKIKRDFALILSGHRGTRKGGSFPKKFNTIEWAELHEIQSQVTAAGFLSSQNSRRSARDRYAAAMLPLGM